MNQPDLDPNKTKHLPKKHEKKKKKNLNPQRSLFLLFKKPYYYILFFIKAKYVHFLVFTIITFLTFANKQQKLLIRAVSERISNTDQETYLFEFLRKEKERERNRDRERDRDRHREMQNKIFTFLGS